MSPVGWLHRTPSGVHRRSAKIGEPPGAHCSANCARRTSVLQTASEPAAEHLRMFTEYHSILTECPRTLTSVFEHSTGPLRKPRASSSDDAQPRFSSEIRTRFSSETRTGTSGFHGAFGFHETFGSYETSGSHRTPPGVHKADHSLTDEPPGSTRTTCSSLENLGFPLTIASPRASSDAHPGS
jgi:hypothetical protein